MTESTSLETRADTGRLRILLVDDDDADRLAVRRCFQRSDLSAALDEARSAAQTMQLLETAAYDCVLLDYYLPDMPGLSLFERIRSAAPGVAVVVFTGRGDEDIAVELMKAGAADYFPKASLTPERLAAGVRHAVGLVRATVARKQAEEELRAEEARFRTLSNAIPQLAWMADSSGARQWFNQKWFDYSGTTLEEAREWGWRRVHHPDHVEGVIRTVERSCSTGEPWEQTYPLLGKDGTYRWFLSRALPIRGGQGNIIGWVGTETDITGQKEAEAERERLLTLEREARTAAERAIETRDELLAIVAHDLRNPLHIITSAASRIVPSISEENRTQYVQFIQRSSREMNRLIDDLLDISRIESGNFVIEREPVDFHAILEEMRELFALQAREKEIAFTCDLDAAVGPACVDRDRVRRLLYNLLGNAFKFTAMGGCVALRTEEREDHIKIVVQDSGPGIPAQHLDHIFDRYWQGNRASRTGAGLGLAICKGIVTAHNGRIWADSELGVGTTFHVTIPRSEA